MARLRRIRFSHVLGSLALPVLLQTTVCAEDLTDDQQKLIGFMGRIDCIASRDGHPYDWESERIQQFLTKDGYYNKELGRFSWQPAVLITVGQVSLAMNEMNCKGVKADSEAWIRALKMTVNLNRDGSPGPAFFE